MTDKSVLIAMTKLAVYDKREGIADRRTNEYFRHDYIYKKNLATRVSAAIGALILVGVYWARLLLIENVDLFEIDLRGRLIDSGLFIVATLAVYSVIGTIQGTREYYLTKKRLGEYNSQITQLERLNERARRKMPESEGGTDLYYGTSPDR